METTTEENSKPKREKAPLPSYETVRSLDIMTAIEAGVYLRTSESRLAKLRHFGGGPVYIAQSARRVLYRRSDLDAWLDDRARTSTSDRGRQ